VPVLGTSFLKSLLHFTFVTTPSTPAASFLTQVLGTEPHRREWKFGTKETKAQDKRTEVQDRRTGVWMLELLMMGIDLEGWRITTVNNKIISWEGGVKPKKQILEGRGMEGQGN